MADKRGLTKFEQEEEQKKLQDRQRKDGFWKKEAGRMQQDKDNAKQKLDSVINTKVTKMNADQAPEAESQISNKFGDFLKKREAASKVTNLPPPSSSTKKAPTPTPPPLPSYSSSSSSNTYEESPPHSSSSAKNLDLDLSALDDAIDVLNVNMNSFAKEEKSRKLRELAAIAERITSFMTLSSFDAKQFLTAIKEFKQKAEEIGTEREMETVETLVADAVALVKSVTPSLAEMTSEDFENSTQQVVISLTNSLNTYNSLVL